MKDVRKIFAVVVAVIGLTGWVMAGTITLDGDFSDWSGADQIDVAPNQEEGTGDMLGDGYDVNYDILDVWITSDDSYLSLSVCTIDSGIIDLARSGYYQFYIDTGPVMVGEEDNGYFLGWPAVADFFLANYEPFAPADVWRIQPWIGNPGDYWNWGEQTDVDYAIGNWNGTNDRIETSIPLGYLGIFEVGEFSVNVYVIFKASAGGLPEDYAPDDLKTTEKYTHTGYVSLPSSANNWELYF